MDLRSTSYLKVCFSIFAALFTLKTQLQSQTPVVTFTSRISGLSAPIDIVNAGDLSNRLFIAQQGASGSATIKVYGPGPTYTFLGDFLTVTGIRTGGEEGLLSIAFHPQYETNRYFFVYYTNSNGDLQLARYQTRLDNANEADPASKDTVLTIPHPVNGNHNGGKLLFGVDGYLYLTTGDGGSGDDPPNNAQNGMVLLGKMLRINVTTTETAPFYTIPPDNPYVTDPNVADEIFATGLRNPFRWSFDRITNDIWIGDVGQDIVEEVNFRAAAQTAGANYGWRCYEGTFPNITGGCAPQSSYVSPVFEYPNPSGGAPPPSAVTGGNVYRGSGYPLLYGYYLSTDFYSGTLYLTRPDGGGGWATSPQTGLTGIAGFGEAENGELYAVRLTNGEVYQILSTTTVPVNITRFTGLLKNGAIELTWHTDTEDNVLHYEVEYSAEGTDFLKAANVPATKAATYKFIHTIPGSNKHYYRLRIVDNDGTWKYSKVILVSSDNNNDKNFVRPSVIVNNILQLELSNTYNTVQLMNMKGSVVYKTSIMGRTGRISLQLPRLPAGNYLVRIERVETVITQKVIIR